MDRGFTQRTLAVRLGCWEQQVGRWEQDRSVPRPARWPALEALLGAGLVPEQPDLAGWIRMGRLRLGLTQEALALRAGVDPRTIRNAEGGDYRPSRRTRRKLEAILG
jgi:transcriptional regulator with XRE-family HTH domain